MLRAPPTPTPQDPPFPSTTCFLAAGCDRSRHRALAPLGTSSNSSRRSRPLHRVSTTSRVARRRRQLFYRPVDVENSLFDRGVLDVVQVFFKRTVLHHLAMGGRIRAQLIACHSSEERRVGKECVSTCISRWSPYH